VHLPVWLPDAAASDAATGAMEAIRPSLGALHFLVALGRTGHVGRLSVRRLLKGLVRRA
jgi:hypothetical protein